MIYGVILTVDNILQEDFMTQDLDFARERIESHLATRHREDIPIERNGYELWEMHPTRMIERRVNTSAWR